VLFDQYKILTDIVLLHTSDAGFCRLSINNIIGTLILQMKVNFKIVLKKKNFTSFRIQVIIIIFSIRYVYYNSGAP